MSKEVFYRLMEMPYTERPQMRMACLVSGQRPVFVAEWHPTHKWKWVEHDKLECAAISPALSAVHHGNPHWQFTIYDALFASHEAYKCWEIVIDDCWELFL